MAISLSAKTQRLIQERMKRGRYATADDVVLAGLASLQQQQGTGDFAPGELDALIAEAEADFDHGKSFDAEEVFAEIRQLSKQFRRKRIAKKK